MTVKELIELLQGVPQEKQVLIATELVSLGEVVRVNEYTAFIELEGKE